MSNNAAPSAPVDPVLHWLRILSGAAGVLAIVQTLLGLGVLGDLGGMFSIHQGIGYLVLLATVAAAVFAVLWSRQSGNKGLMMHAITVAVLALIQIGIAQMGVVWLHVIVGVLILIAAIALFTLSMRGGGASRSQRREAAPRA
jgi:hypothetical protein